MLLVRPTLNDETSLITHGNKGIKFVSEGGNVLLYSPVRTGIVYTDQRKSVYKDAAPSDLFVESFHYYHISNCLPSALTVENHQTQLVMRGSEGACCALTTRKNVPGPWATVCFKVTGFPNCIQTVF